LRVQHGNLRLGGRRRAGAPLRGRPLSLARAQPRGKPASPAAPEAARRHRQAVCTVPVIALLPWILFIGLVLVLLALDLGVFNRDPHEVSIRESLIWTAVWITIALLFGVFIYYACQHHWFGIGLAVGLELDGKTAALQYLTGYVIEKSLS